MVRAGLIGTTAKYWRPDLPHYRANRDSIFFIFSPKGLVLDFGSLRAISPSSVVIKGGTCWDLSMGISKIQSII